MGWTLDVVWSSHDGRTSLVISGWPAEFEALAADPARSTGRLGVLPAALVDAGIARQVQPSPGRFEAAGESVRFVPRFPFVVGTAYSLLIFGPDGDGPPLLVRELGPAPGLAQDGPAAEVAGIFPSSAEVPVNLLKLYIHFSAPMSEGCAARCVTVCRADDGRPLEDVFLNGPELWDTERRRLTVLLDPGRIKRGLRPNVESGYPLAERVPIRVNVAVEFRDASGRPLGAGADRTYTVGAAWRSRVDPTSWGLAAPRAGTRDALAVEFDRPLDRALLAHSLGVADPDDASLPGSVAIPPGERSWRFEPASPWQDGRHALVVNGRLEDLAGNSVTRVFDRELDLAAHDPLAVRRVEVPFDCLPAATPRP